MKHLGDITKINGAEIEPVDCITAKVYMYRFPNGKIYIGVTTKTIEERRDSGYHHNTALRDAMRLYGWKAVEKTILAEFDNLEDAFEEEKRQIKIHNATDPSVGYNISSGGKSTFKGLSHSEKYKAYMSNLYKGKAFTEEHKQHLRDAHVGERKPVVKVSADGEIVASYGSLGDAAKDLGGYKSNIARACEEGRMYKGFCWKFGKVVM